MRKIIAIIFCAVIMMCAVSFAASAEDSIFTSDGQSAPVSENLPTSDEIVTESEFLDVSASPETEAAPKDTVIIPGTEISVPSNTVTESIVSYIKAHFEEISVIVTMILTVFYQVRKHISLNKSIGVLNNNAIVVAESSSKAMKDALEEVRSVGATVNGYKEDISSLLAEIRKNAEENKRLEEALLSANEYMKKAKEANIEFSNELAELLVLANIPNSKKDELYSRHRAAVDAIDASEVKENDGKEA